MTYDAWRVANAQSAREAEWRRRKVIRVWRPTRKPAGLSISFTTDTSNFARALAFARSKLAELQAPHA